MNDLKLFLHNHFSMSIDAAEKMSEIISVVDIEKGKEFVKKGCENMKEYLVLDGICRSYLLNSNEDEVTLSFFTPYSAISPNVTRTVFHNSILSIQAITAVKIGSFDSADLMSLMMDYREIEIWANTILQNELINKVNKEISQISLTAKDKLLEFRKRYEALENLIPHSYIASYLGITNVSLSRIRKELAN